jgi:membrane associated rhomboid family serine protease
VIPLKDNIPTDRVPVVTIALILINVIVYLISIRHGGSLLSGPSESTVVHYAAIPYAFTHYGHHCGLVTAGVDPFSGTVVQQVACEGQAGVTGTASVPIPTWFSAFSAMFMHGGLLHIGGNMLFLWIFGNNVEDSMGRVKYLLFYLVGGLIALGAQIAVGPNSTTPTLGASGAIAAVLGAYILLYPRARVLALVIIIFFFTVVELPAVAVLLIWVAIDAVLPALGQIGHPGAGTGGGVAYFAHLGGFIFGLLMVRALAKRRKQVGYGPKYPVY